MEPGPLRNYLYTRDLSPRDLSLSPRDLSLSPRDLSPRDLSPNVAYVTPTEIAALYSFPAGSTGKQQTVGIIELGGGYNRSDLLQYRTSLGITGTPNIVDVSVDGAVNVPPTPASITSADQEVNLDIQIVSAVAPDAAIRVYFCPNSFTSFKNGVVRATQDNCNIISISWGLAETGWPAAQRDQFNSALMAASAKNISVFCAAGDNGATDGTGSLCVDFPASSPYVVGCGGTSVTIANAAIVSETVWNNDPTTSATGGGRSGVFARPAWQSTLTSQTGTTRCVPDVSGHADPNNGYLVFISDRYYRIGGTSAVSPLWSAYIARVNEKRLSAVGFYNPVLYTSLGALCGDVTQGDNGGYSSSVGWDFCTGWGSPTARLTTAFLEQSPITPSFTATPSSGRAPLAVSFRDTSSFNFTVTSRLWNFGNGSTSTLQNPVQTFRTPGRYTVVLTVNGTFSVTGYVNALPAPPVASFRSLTVTFSDTSTNSPTSWLWSFGDGGSSTQQNPTYTFPRAGRYTVSLVATNAAGSSVRFSKVLTLV